MPKIRRVPPHQIALETAKRVIKHSPHDSTPMTSGSSVPPIFMWICPIAGCQSVEYTYVRGQIPVCNGGFESAITHIFDGYNF